MSTQTQNDVVVEGGSYHTWTYRQLQALPPERRAFTQGHLYKNIGFRTVINHRQTMESTAT